MSVPIPLPRSTSRASLASLHAGSRSYIEIEGAADEMPHRMSSSYGADGHQSPTKRSLPPRSSTASRRMILATEDSAGVVTRRTASVVGVDAQGNETIHISSLPAFWECGGGGLLPHGSVASSCFNLASATLGAGTLTLPLAMADAGVVLGSVLLLIAYIETVFSIRLLVLVAECTGQRTYEEISLHLFGRGGKFLTAGTIIVFCFGIAVLYLVYIGDILEIMAHNLDWVPAIFTDDSGRRLAMFIYWLLFMLPLSLMKEINSLRYASLVGMASTAMLVLAMFVDATRFGAFHNIPLAKWDMAALKAVPVFTFCFCCQPNAFEIYAELKDASVHRMTFTSAVSMYACTAIYLVASISGVSEFGGSVDGNVLRSYTDVTSKWYILLAMLGVTFTLTMAFPICIFPMRDALLQAMGFEDVFDVPAKWRIGVSFGLAAGALLGGLFLQSASLLVGVLGGVCGGLVATGLPALFAFKSGAIASCGLGQKIAAAVMGITGVILGVGSSIIAVVG